MHSECTDGLDQLCPVEITRKRVMLTASLSAVSVREFMLQAESGCMAAITTLRTLKFMTASVERGAWIWTSVNERIIIISYEKYTHK